ncbi:hypothetical protein BpHYR1_026273 [Brachionus plicatilis]|uniref:Uncharacterized protein n=1 Tax=Brachionus plicatilis TaxID=10195 RepID=A0A3M7QW42_BRAPC|nr:hypothetical protein BpHYR1_026273 [Brachionus plicatilis]
MLSRNSKNLSELCDLKKASMKIRVFKYHFLQTEKLIENFYTKIKLLNEKITFNNLTGKTIVEFFSEAMAVRVCRHFTLRLFPLGHPSSLCIHPVLFALTERLILDRTKFPAETEYLERFLLLEGEHQKSTFVYESMHGTIKNIPGPRAPPGKILPSRNITALSYS